VGSTPVRIERVGGETEAANAMATGIGPSARVFIWDTFLDGRYSDREIEVVAAHEFGHIAHHHIWKGLAWSLLLTVPGFWLVERATRRRGGLERPEVVPLALLVLAVIGLAITPLGNAVSRRYEAEADWTALQTTHDPDPAESMFKKFTVYDLVQPNPPGWSYVWIDNHPTVAQRVAMARAWKARQR
jgi:STE24 endopeptidase